MNCSFKIGLRAVWIGLILIAVAVSAAPAYGQAIIIQDQFTAATGGSLNGNTPDGADLPGTAWQNGGAGSGGRYSGGTQAQINGTNGGPLIQLNTATYTAPTLLTISAALKGGGSGTDYSPQFRGLGLGFSAWVMPSTVNAVNGGFQGMAINNNGTVGLYLTDMPGQAVGGQTESPTFSSTINYQSVFGAAYSASNFYTLSYTINTVSGVISKISLSNGSVTDTADFSNLDGMVTTITGAAAAYAGLINSGTGSSVAGFAQNFEVVAPPAGPAWTGTTNTTWATAGNWTGGVPGATSGTTNTDTAVFNTYNATNPTPVVDANRNLQGINFDNPGGNLTSPLTLGTTTGNALLLTNGGMIQTKATVANPMTVNAPMVLEGTNGTYTFTSNATTASATLSFGGGHQGRAAGGTTRLTLNGTNTGASTRSAAPSATAPAARRSH